MGNPRALPLQAGGLIRGRALPASQAQTPHELRTRCHKTAGELSQRAPLSPLRRLTGGSCNPVGCCGENGSFMLFWHRATHARSCPALVCVSLLFFFCYDFFFLVCYRPVQPTLKPIPCAEPLQPPARAEPLESPRCRLVLVGGLRSAGSGSARLSGPRLRVLFQHLFYFSDYENKLGGLEPDEHPASAGR